MNNFKIINGFFLEQDSFNNNEFEKLYISLRKKEGRVFNEKEIASLPAVPSSHPHYKEWEIRKDSCNNLLNYIKKNGHVCDILEVGCGNGWLAAQLSSVAKGEVIGIDINRLELKQAKKVFRRKHNLNFLAGDIHSGILAHKKFDLIVFAASIQYFKSLKEIVKTALPYLTLQGEIHILDTHFYTRDGVSVAKQRTKEYFSDLGFPEMSRFYFYHRFYELESFNYFILFNPHSWINKLLLKKNPFFWIMIKNNYS